MPTLSVAANSHKRKFDEMSGPNRYELLETIGEGGTAKVSRAFDKVARREVAVKFPRTPNHSAVQQRELEHLSKLQDDDHFPKLLDFYTADGSLVLVEELLPPDMFETFSKSGTKPIRWEGVVTTAHEGLLALSALKKRKLMHTDVKSDNLVLDPESGRVKVIDFGNSRTVQQHQRESRIQPRMGRAPEVVYKRPKIDGSIDVWSLGCTLVELAARTDLFAPEKGDDDPEADLDLVRTTAKVRGLPSQTWISGSEILDSCFTLTDKHTYQIKGEDPSTPFPAVPFAQHVKTCVQTARPELPPLQADLFADFTDKVVDYERLDVDEALKHPFFPYREIFCDKKWEEGDECLFCIWPASSFLDDDDETPLLQVDLAALPKRSRHMIPLAKDNLYLVRIYLNADNIVDEIFEIPPRTPLFFDGETLSVGSPKE